MMRLYNTRQNRGHKMRLSREPAEHTEGKVPDMRSDDLGRTPTGYLNWIWRLGCHLRLELGDYLGSQALTPGFNPYLRCAA